MSESQQARKATVDDIVRELQLLNEKADRYEKYMQHATAKQGEIAKRLDDHRFNQRVLAGIVFVMACIAWAGADSASGNLAELMAQNAAATKTILPGILGIIAAVGIWRSFRPIVTSI